VSLQAAATEEMWKVFPFTKIKLLFYGDDRPEAKKRRKKWMDFVLLKRAKWEPSQSSVLCSEHFKKEDFVRSADLGDEKNQHTSKRWLRIFVFHLLLLTN